MTPGPTLRCSPGRCLCSKSLETLSLHTSMRSLAGWLSFPMLHLEGLRELRVVDLDKVLPSSIRLRAGCELHIFLTGRLIPCITALWPVPLYSVICVMVEAWTAPQCQKHSLKTMTIPLEVSTR